MSEIEHEVYGGQERRTRPQVIVQQQKERRNLLDWIQAFAPALVVVAGGIWALGGLEFRMDAQADAIKKLEGIPLQIASIRAELAEATSDIKIDQADKMSTLRQRVSIIEATSKRNAVGIEAVWQRIREIEIHRNGTGQ